jgi:hypothetical protein
MPSTSTRREIDPRLRVPEQEAGTPVHHLNDQVAVQGVYCELVSEIPVYREKTAKIIDSCACPAPNV